MKTAINREFLIAVKKLSEIMYLKLFNVKLPFKKILVESEKERCKIEYNITIIEKIQRIIKITSK